MCVVLDLSNIVDKYRLMGPGIEVIVGPADACYGPSKTWSLPQALISYFSPFLKAACVRDFKEREANRIRLPEDEPEVFSLFVEWMYYDRYSLDPLLVASETFSANADTKAWVLGDKLLNSKFKNYSMTRLVSQHTQGPTFQPVRTIEIDYACSNSLAGSKLRRLFFDLLAKHLGNAKRVQGTVKDWDEVLQNHSNARLFLLRRFNKASSEGELPKKLADYLNLDRNARMTGEKAITPAKRNAQGAPV